MDERQDDNNPTETISNPAEDLKRFLLDIDCLDALSQWTSKANLFDVLKITRAEIRHSNMLAWLMNPNENHGLGDSLLRGIIQYVATSFSNDEDIFPVLLMDCHDFTVQREWQNIDILAHSSSEKFVICIENKIGSKEHDNQLNRYRVQIEKSFPKHRKMFVYLSPTRDEPSDQEFWCPMGYEDIIDILVKAKHRTELPQEAAFMIDSYIEIVRRDIVGDDELARTCQEIYAKHQRALDLIFENKPDQASEVAEILRKWCKAMDAKGEIEFAPKKNGKTFTQFKTPYMNKLMPDSATSLSEWKTHNYYFYEIVNNGTNFFIKLTFNSKDIPDDLRATCENICKHFPPRQKKANWKWCMVFKSQEAKVGEEVSEEKIFTKLDRMFQEVKNFEQELMTIMPNEETD